MTIHIKYFIFYDLQMTYKIDTFIPKLNKMKHLKVIHCVSFFTEKNFSMNIQKYLNYYSDSHIQGQKSLNRE